MKRPVSVEPVSRERAAAVYAEEFARYYPHPASEEAIARFSEAYVGRDYFGLEFAFNGLNGAAREAFARLSGMALPAGQAAGREVLRKWAGIPQELIDLRRASKAVASQRSALEHRMRHQPELVDQSINWINQQLDAGFDQMMHVGRRYYLANAEGRGIDLSKKSSGLHQLRPMIEAILDLRAKETAYVRVMQGEPAEPAETAEAGLDAAIEIPLADADGTPDFRM